MARLSRPDARELLVNEDRSDRAELEERLLELRAELTEAEQIPARSVREARRLAEVADALSAEIEQIEAKLVRPDRARVLRRLVEAEDVDAEWQATPVDIQRAVLRMLFTVTVLPAPRGRPKGHRPGQPYFDRTYVDIRPV